MNLAIRVDASARMGTGHFMRCLTLADAAGRSGGRVRLVSRGLPDHLTSMVAAHGHELAPLPPSAAPAVSQVADDYAAWLGVTVPEDADQTLTALADRVWDWIAVDHYGIGVEWERRVRATIPRVMAIDDLANREHDCDVLLDQNGHSRLESRYSSLVSFRTRQLLGPRFALLRPEFWAARGASVKSGRIARVVVSFGGVDVDNHTSGAVDALRELAWPDVAVDVVIGAGHSHRRELEQACEAAGFACLVQVGDMAAVLGLADIAIGTGGIGLWERCCLGVPSLLLVTAENQRAQVAYAANEGWVWAPDPPGSSGHVAWWRRHLDALRENQAQRSAMSSRGSAAVDGRGVERVLEALHGQMLAMREVTAADSEALFTWRNDPGIRAASRNAAPVERARHEQWIAKVLGDPTRLLLVAEVAGKPRGVVRFDLVDDVAEVSVYLVPASPAIATGGQVLAAAEAWLAVHRPTVKRLRAEVLADNRPSHRLFCAGGYIRQSTWYSKDMPTGPGVS